MTLEHVLLNSESAAAWLGVVAGKSRQRVIYDRICVLEVAIGQLQLRLSPASHSTRALAGRFYFFEPLFFSLT
jgi:hypothetical protein